MRRKTKTSTKLKRKGGFIELQEPIIPDPYPNSYSDRIDAPIWNEMKRLINKIPNESEFTRKYLIDELKKYYNFGLYYITTSTIDNYRLGLTKMGFIEIIKRGVYKKITSIPEELTTSHLHKFSRNENSWYSWFVEKEDLPKVLNKL